MLPSAIVADAESGLRQRLSHLSESHDQNGRCSAERFTAAPAHVTKGIVTPPSRQPQHGVACIGKVKGMEKAERFNSISHLVGAALALAGAAVLVSVAAMDGDSRKILSYSVYGLTLFLLYLFSTLYHSLDGRAKRVFRVLDHQAIYLLIAGTYTPFTLVALDDSPGLWMFGTIWALAVFGIILDALPSKGRRVVPIIIYLAMGWLCLFALDSIVDALPPAGFRWLLAGGILYTSGILFYVLDHRYPWCHGVWHLFVLAGSASHYFTILLFL